MTQTTILTILTLLDGLSKLFSPLSTPHANYMLLTCHITVYFNSIYVQSWFSFSFSPGFRSQCLQNARDAVSGNQIFPISRGHTPYRPPRISHLPRSFFHRLQNSLFFSVFLLFCPWDIDAWRGNVWPTNQGKPQFLVPLSSPTRIFHARSRSFMNWFQPKRHNTDCFAPTHTTSVKRCSLLTKIPL